MKPTNADYSELSLGENSKARLLTNLTHTFGFEYKGPTEMEGLSGLRHNFEGVGIRDKRIVLVCGGAEEKTGARREPRDRMIEWRNRALLSTYDVRALLARDGWDVDVIFFHNLYSRPVEVPDLKDWEGWLRQNKLGRDTLFSLRWSMNEIPVLRTDELSSCAQSVGACFFTLEDLTLSEAALLSGAVDASTLAACRDICTRTRTLQYFRPPTDEMILTALDLAGHSKNAEPLVREIYETAQQMGHTPTENVLVPKCDFTNPVETAKALQCEKYISFESSVEWVTPEGKKITQKIKKTAQGSFILRLLREIKVPQLVKAAIQALKHQ